MEEKRGVREQGEWQLVSRAILGVIWEPNAVEAS